MQHLFLFLFISFGLNLISAQTITLTQASMSTGDLKKKFVQIGHSSNNQLCLIDLKGDVYEYDGYSLTLWSNISSKNLEFFQSIYLKDSFLFVSTKEKLLQFSQHSTKPQVIDSNTGISKFLSKGTYNEPVIDKVNDVFQSFKNRVVWKNSEDKIMDELFFENPSKIIVDQWNSKWLLYENKLYKLHVKRLHTEKSAWAINGKEPKNIFYTSSAAVCISDDHIIHIRYPHKVVQTRHELKTDVLSVIEDNKGVFWLYDDAANLLKVNNGLIDFWASDVTGIREKPINVSVDGDIISFVLAKGGIIQAKTAIKKEEYIWLSHRTNRKLKKDKIIGSYFDEILYVFTENNGVFTIDNRTIGSISSPRKPWKIIGVKAEKSYSILLDEGKRWYKLRYSDKKIIPINQSSLPPEITSQTFHIVDSKIWYKSSEKLIAIDILTEDWFSQACPLEWKDFGHFEDYFYEYQFNTLYRFYPEAYPTEILSPILHEAFFLSSKGEKHQLYPIENSKINIETNDYPLQFWAKASYLQKPKEIEYGWKWNGGDKLDRDLSYRAETQLRTKFIGEIAPSITLNHGENGSIYPLAHINTIRSPKESSSDWAVYLSSILAGVLLISFFVFRNRSNRQKRKIEKLEAEKKMVAMEQKALQLQMNPHFIFNAMNGVKGMIALGEAKKARQYLTKISSWMRNMLNDARTDSISIQQEIQNLTMYLEIEKELRGNVWEYEINSEVNENLYIPPMMIQPFVENAIIHAFKNGNGGKISLEFVQKGRRMQVKVEDNGVGRIAVNNKHKSVAMSLIKERLKLMNQGTKLEEFSIIDKTIEKHGSTGVIVSIVLPISNKHESSNN